MGCDEAAPGRGGRLLCFNPRTHMGCDEPMDEYTTDYDVSIHAPTWGATCGSARLNTLACVSIHAPTWGATLGGSSSPVSISVSIHAPTWGATHGSVSGQGAQHVSIHAPTWGATGQNSGYTLTAEVSIHAPTWGATFPASTAHARYTSFNPRTHMGCDAVEGLLLPDPAVSIHAPTWGATLESNVAYSVEVFQSTHPHGVRLHIQ